ncbi:zinc ribbon domain-containing protein [Sulfurimonas sp. CVO]|uniref:zinc ribbon domain-containing protein n=1 Tax=Sulfurimonas sp. CVO TaxID=2283483 RepID=UPI00132F4E2D|nr:zinc ribbon domain-containing protein [Sulfurimonas sp. CVO]QHG91422.1 zinc ribbon domain-containing protein [Sulfurimonas sp. CVO]
MIYVSWLILAILVGVYAKGKGKSGFLYFILSVILSPLVGFLIAIISGDNEEELVEQGKKRKCSNCGELIRPEAKVCKFCNSEIIDGIIKTTTQEDNDKFKISFQIKNENSWNNIKTKLFAYYKKQNIENIISEKEMSWMLGGNEGVKGYIQATLNEDIIIIESFKLPKPDIEIINSETKQKEEEKTVQKNNSTDKLIELGKLLEKELITKEEFEEEKKKILAS